jgi:peptide/nickel transport system substrate-binding protein
MEGSMKRLNLLLCLVVVITFFAGCAAPAPQVIEKEVTKVVEQKVVETVVVAGTPQVVEKVITATPAPKTGPVAGGKFTYAMSFEPDSLDAHKSGDAFTVCQFIGASLVARHPETSEYVPYLAESWTKSADGLTYEFKLRKDVKFHDGTPLTAKDYAFTFMRAIDPATKSPTAGQTLVGLKSAEAVDDYTLRLNMSMPNSVLIDSLSNTCYLQPLPQAAVEKMGDDFGRSPIGTGPFKFKEWVTGEKIVLERNPDFNWGPAFTHGSAPYIETLEFRIIPEYATRVAALESGDVDLADVETKDVKRIEDLGKYQVYKSISPGSGVHVEMNSTRPPFDELRVRQALNYAVDRKAIVQAVSNGLGVPLYGPLTPSTMGYWPGAEYVGYPYDPAKAKALLTEAGYKPNASGIMEKDGKSLSFTLLTYGTQGKTGEILQQQFKDIGVEVKLQNVEYGVLFQTLAGGDFDLAIDVLGWPNAGVLFVMFHSSTIGLYNRSRVTSLDPAIGAMVVATTQDGFEKAAGDLQRSVVENAYMVPLYGPADTTVINNRVQGPLSVPAARWLYLYDAYLETGPQK